MTLAPLETGTVAQVAGATGKFCTGQNHAGAYGQPNGRCVREFGAPAGDLTDGASHGAVLAATFCIGTTGAPSVDTVADLPGPGSIGLNGTLVFLPGP